VQCVNPFMESVELLAGSMVGRFYSVQEGDVGLSLGEMVEAARRPTMSGN